MNASLEPKGVTYNEIINRYTNRIIICMHLSKNGARPHFILNFPSSLIYYPSSSESKQRKNPDPICIVPVRCIHGSIYPCSRICYSCFGITLFSDSSFESWSRYTSSIIGSDFLHCTIGTVSIPLKRLSIDGTQFIRSKWMYFWRNFYSTVTSYCSSCCTKSRNNLVTNIGCSHLCNCRISGSICLNQWNISCSLYSFGWSISDNISSSYSNCWFSCGCIVWFYIFTFFNWLVDSGCELFNFCLCLWNSIGSCRTSARTSKTRWSCIFYFSLCGCISWYRSAAIYDYWTNKSW